MEKQNGLATHLRARPAGREAPTLRVWAMNILAAAPVTSHSR
jgi:hypothetical protein